jgi:peptide/nickel transport system substrate-binding protein
VWFVRGRWRFLAILLVLLLAAAACGGDDDDEAGGSGDDSGSDDGGGDGGDGSEITIALGSEPTSLDPQAVDDGGERAINDNIYETLLARSPEGELEPGLASELPEQQDETTWRFTLREDVTFHNGEPFNADSVVASVERMIRLIESESTDQSGFFASITGAEKVDDTTVDITTDGPDGVLPARMYWMKMIPASAADSDDLTDDPVGTGPYKFVEFARGDHVTIEANADYWDGAPDIGRVTYRFIEEPGSRLAGLLSGEYDLITNLQPEDVDRAPKSAQVQGQEHPVLILDADEGITADVRVRQALNHAIDKDELVEQLFGGFAEVDAGQLLSPSILGYNDDLEPYEYDLDKAKELLDEAGASGQTITIVSTSGRWLKDRELTEAVAGYWSEAGLEVETQILEFGAYLDELFNRDARADSIYVSSSNDILDADRQLSTYYQSGGVGSSNTDDELSGLITDARQATDEDERTDLYNEALQLAYDQAYFVWLVNNQDIYGMSEDLDWAPRVDAKLLVKEMEVA